MNEYIQHKQYGQSGQNGQCEQDGQVWTCINSINKWDQNEQNEHYGQNEETRASYYMFLLIDMEPFYYKSRSLYMRRIGQQC